MNKNLRKYIISGMLSIMVLAPMSNSAHAMGNVDADNLYNLETNMDENRIVEFDNKGRAVVKENDVTYIMELTDIHVEDDQILIESGLLDEDYKEKALEQNLRGSKSFTVWYEHPVTYTTTITGYTNASSGIITVLTGDVTATMTASKNKSLRVTMSHKNIKTYNGYSLSSTKKTDGAYVVQGKTSVASTNFSLSKPGYLVIGVPAKFNAKHNGVVSGNAQVGFGISALLSW